MLMTQHYLNCQLSYPKSFTVLPAFKSFCYSRPHLIVYFVKNKELHKNDSYLWQIPIKNEVWKERVQPHALLRACHKADKKEKRLLLFWVAKSQTCFWHFFN